MSIKISSDASNDEEFCQVLLTERYFPHNCTAQPVGKNVEDDTKSSHN